MKDNNPGNYVSLDVSGLPLHLVATLPGIVNTDPHITVMYSKNSNVPLSHIDYVMQRKKIIGSSVFVSGVNVFDSSPNENNERDVSKGCLVLTIKSVPINDLHDQLCRLGCKHSYTPFHAHATLIYDCDLEQCKLAAEEIQKLIDSGQTFPLTITGYKNNRIKENWTDSLK